MVGKLDPLRGKFDTDHFKNWLQIEQRMILRLKKMKFFIFEEEKKNKRKKRVRDNDEEDLRKKKKRKIHSCEINHVDKIKKNHTLQVEKIRKENFNNDSDLLMSFARISFKFQEDTQKRINGLTKNNSTLDLPYFNQIINLK